MLRKLRSKKALGALGGIVLVVLIAALALSGGSDENGGDVIDLDRDPDRSPDKAIVIPLDEPIIVGVSTALTGPIGERGSEYLDAVYVGIEHWRETNGDLIGGHEIEVRAEDDGCSEADIAETAAQRHVRRPGLVGVIGPQCSGGSVEAKPVYQEYGVVAISGSATKTDLTTSQPDNGFFFRTAYRNDLEGALIALFLNSTLEVDVVYLIDDSEPFGLDLADATQQLLETADVTVIRKSIRAGDVDFSILANEIATFPPDFVAFAGFNPEAGLLLRQIRDAGYDGLYGAGDAAASQSNFVEPLGATAEGALFSGCQYPLSGHFLDDFLDLLGEAPVATFPAQYADAVIALLDAVKEVAEEQPDGSLSILPTDLRDAVRSTVIEDGFSGSFTFDVNGDRVPEVGDLLSEVQDAAFAADDEQALLDLGLIQCQVQDGELVPVGDPPDRDVRL
jgi:ABC-type branched-subunit amino acid transport system substrate-binding protein